MNKQDIIFLITFCALVIAVVLMSLCTTSRSRRIVEVPHVIVDWQRDTLTQTDSIYIDRWHTLTMSGDTVFRTDSVLIEKWKVRSDIREVIKHDSIAVPYEVETIKECRHERLTTRLSRGSFGWEFFPERSFLALST